MKSNRRPAVADLLQLLGLAILAVAPQSAF
jgi:hypothetical protein